MHTDKITQNRACGTGSDRKKGRLFCLIAAFLALVLVGLSGCANKRQTEAERFFEKIFSLETYQIYTADIPQGNTIDKQKMDRLKPGMNKEQVVYLLGAPLGGNVFRRDRWDYVHYVRKDKKLRDVHRVTLYFEGDNLVRVVRYRPVSKNTMENKAQGNAKKQPAN